jgi:hypothetical protein
MIHTGANTETAEIASIGSAGATTVGAATAVGVTVIPVPRAFGFREGQTITIDAGANAETAVIAAIRPYNPASISVAAPLTLAHAAGAQLSGTGVTLTAPLAKEHASGAQITDNVPTPGAANKYSVYLH